MALDSLTPTLWAPSFLKPLYKSHVFAGLTNKQYEGLISNYGDSVKIHEVGAITINDYTKFSVTGSTSTAITWQALTAAEKMLIIDQAKYFSFAVDKVDLTQNLPKPIEQGLEQAGYAMADEIDTFLSELIADGSGNIVTAATVSAGSALSLVSRFARELDENNVPQNGRFLVVPPFFHQDLVEAFSGGISATSVPKEFTGGVLANGFVGQVYGFNVLMSNNCHTSSGTAIISAFHQDAVAYAGQLTHLKYVEREDYFDQGVKGLYLYGAKVIRPSAIVTCDVTEG